MPPVECLHLKHVLQTVYALEAVVLRSFGPDGGQVLFTKDTGQVMLSRSGTRILRALQLENPLARLVVECVLQYSTKTGDGSKTFILLLASLLRMIHTTASTEPNVSRTYNSREVTERATARCLADKLLAFSLEKLGDIISFGVLPFGFSLLCENLTTKTQSPTPTKANYVQQLLASFFFTRLGHNHFDFATDLICKLLAKWKFETDGPSSSLQFIVDNFPALHTRASGFPISSSHLIEGQVLHRDFATPCLHPDKQPVKAIVFSSCLQQKMLNEGDILELGGGQRQTEEKIVRFSLSAERSLECVFANLQRLGVSVFLSAVKQSAAVLALATQAGMCVVECVSEDELSLFVHLSGAPPVSDCMIIRPENVATLNFCRPILLGAHRCVHMAFCDSEEDAMVKPFSVVICGSGEGQTDQYACAFQDSICMLLTTLEPMDATSTSERTLQSSRSTSSPMDNQNNRTKSFSLRSSNPQTSVVKQGYVIPAGGTFEFLLHHALLQHTRSSLNSTDTDMPVVLKLLANALLCVPRHIYFQRVRHSVQTQTRVLSYSQNPSQFRSTIYKHKPIVSPIQGHGQSPPEDYKSNIHCYGKVGVVSEVFTLDAGLESVSCKYHLILAVLQCVTRLLRIDALLRTHMDLRKYSHRLTNISWEPTEDED